MENKINIAEILRECPKGMKLYSPIFGDVYLDKIRPHLAIVVTTDKQGDFKEEFLYDGRYGMNGKCMLFPSKEKNTWEGFQRPFKDGDIITCNNLKYTFVAIFKKMNTSTTFIRYASLILSCEQKFSAELSAEESWSDFMNPRFATEEEKQKLFQTLRENGYKWNAETKTLEKLEDMEDKGNISDGYHTFNELYEYRLLYVLYTLDIPQENRKKRKQKENETKIITNDKKEI